MSQSADGFVSEPIQPVVGTTDAAALATGGPGLPSEFVWRGKPLVIAAVRRTWRETGPCRNGSGEAYVRKHWFEVETAAGERATLYFERQGRTPGSRMRWWLYTIGVQDCATASGIACPPNGVRCTERGMVSQEPRQ